MDDVDRSGFGAANRGGRSLEDGPPIDRIETVFAVYEARQEDGQIVYYGDPLTHPERVVRELWPIFRERAGMTPTSSGVTASTRSWPSRPAWGSTGSLDEHRVVPVDGRIDAVRGLVLVSARSDCRSGRDLAGLAVHSSYSGVLGVHEMGHYVMSRYHQVDASLPYFIPVPTLIGTMGAVITLKGRMPDRKALFDIGAAGPLAGLVATVVATVIGLHLPPVSVDPALLQNPDAVRIELGYPPLLELLAAGFDQPLYRNDPTTGVNPVVIGAWVGMLVTFLNLIPVGQLDGATSSGRWPANCRRRSRRSSRARCSRSPRTSTTSTATA